MNNLKFSKLLLLLGLSACGNQVLGWPVEKTDDSDINDDSSLDDSGGHTDDVAPTVIWTTPGNQAMEVAPNATILAVFSEEMDSSTLTSASFEMKRDGVAVPGTVFLLGSTAFIDPTEDMVPNADYTATLSTAAKDLAGNPLAEAYSWDFTVGTGAPTVGITDPLADAVDVPWAQVVRATFSEPMNPQKINSSTFVLRRGVELVPGVVDYNVATRVGSFTPDEDLAEDRSYTATISTVVEDVGGTTMKDEYQWTFSTFPIPWVLDPPEMGSLINFVALAGDGMLNSSSSGTTTLVGDVGLSPVGTCVADELPCTEINPLINGTLYANDAFGVAALAQVDLGLARTDGMSRSNGTPMGDLSGRVLLPGVYTSASAMFVDTHASVTLNGGGDENSVWIFQVGTSLTVSDDVDIILTNGASANNIYWVVDGIVAIDNNVTFFGNVLSEQEISVGTETVIIGRLLTKTGALELRSNAVALPIH